VGKYPRSRTARVMTTKMRTVETVDRKTRENLREERARESDWEPISGSHQGQRSTRAAFKGRIHDAPERFADSQIRSCTAGAVHT